MRDGYKRGDDVTNYNKPITRKAKTLASVIMVE